jgi:hypothetical protein
VPTSSPAITPNGGTNPLSPGVPTPLPTTTSAQPTIITNTSTNSSGSSTLSSSDAVLIVTGAVVLLAGISFFIWRDARRRAPVRSGAGGGDLGLDGRRAGSKVKPKARKLSPAERRRRKRGRARR